RVITPHPGEMARLTGRSTAEIQAGREAVAQGFAERYACTVVLKGVGTIVASPGVEPWINTTGNAGLASGGTGDVLSGLTGGLMAQGMAVHDAAALGVYVHGLAGDLAAEALTQRGMVASDVLERLPAAWRLLEQGS
ncbi:MAG: bifunctional ADP-dependent NAD(P)H-hydrate dehydratase/NAD(P)H-hydrate epimerase, partial [Nitrospiraceae bacterium]|nr:bifunctional ADP-dependent NAD(P)H-hydrate dehydratase/NAD(P)H-hydrate epimerase [Nitrospiraceae bacterium]